MLLGEIMELIENGQTIVDDNKCACGGTIWIQASDMDNWVCTKCDLGMVE